MRIAVTGATGFIGPYILNELSQHTVAIVLVTRRVEPFNVVRQNCNIEIVQFDLRNPPDNCFELMGYPDVLIHLAWGGLPNYNSLHHFEDELPIHYGFLKKLVQSGLSKLVVSGTCFEYGMQNGQLKESLPVFPNNPYGYAKNSLRCQLEYLQEVNPFSLVWARLFYVYGEGQSKHSLLSQLTRAIKNAEKVFNMSGGEQLRDYLPVTEVAKYLVHLALNSNSNGIINICSGRPISIRKFVEQWLEKNNLSIKLNLGYYPYSDYEPLAFWGDCSKLRELIT